MLDLVFHNSTTSKTYGESFFKKIVAVGMQVTGLASKKIELSISLVGKRKIQDLNDKHRDKNKPTDVLSFPLNQKLDEKSAIGGIISLGDIFICFPIAQKYAKEEGMGLASKLAFLTIHGFLHLLGYDHGNTKDQKKMFVLQKKILAKL